ncbi:hypothetical protein GCM10009827_109880 [Dactylosporangium maewongense]|uniref:S-adenosyl methyltransferase n=1 Tax=Dactylosporangium maewongense TaxID=634393 RepID=A0ABN2D5C9_9ACTN
MDFRDVETAEELVRNIWDVGVLFALQRQSPLRYSELGAELTAWSGRRPGDSALTRSLERLSRAHLITAEGSSRERPRYTITSAGAQRIERVRTVVNALRPTARKDQRPIASASTGTHVESMTRHTPIGPGHAHVPTQRSRPRRTSETVTTEAALRQSKTDDEPNSNGRTAPPPPSPIDTSVPHPARRYDYWLGGKDNFEADRASGDAVAQIYPAIRTTALENRRFLHRVVRFLAQEAGIRQFLDIGTGIPTSPNTHEIAQAIAPASRVVYVDNDPIVLTHARALLTGTGTGTTAYIDADVRDPARILDDPQLRSTLDLSQPVALLMVAVLHFIPEPLPAVQQLVQAMASGSYLAITHITKDLLPADIAASADDTNARSGVAAWFRGRDEFAALFDGLELVPPGIQPIAEWRDDRFDDRPSPSEAALYGAVARIP